MPQALRRGFNSLVLLLTWSLWKKRNRRVFEGISMLPLLVAASAVEEGNAWIAAGFQGLSILRARLEE